LSNKLSEYTVYLIECRDGTWYCGITTNIERRMKEHNIGVGCKYTRGRGPVILRGLSEEMSHSEALKLEWRVKKESKNKKLDTLTEGRK